MYIPRYAKVTIQITECLLCHYRFFIFPPSIFIYSSQFVAKRGFSRLYYICLPTLRLRCPTKIHAFFSFFCRKVIAKRHRFP